MNKLFAAIFGVSFFCLVPFFILSIYNQPVGDDFWSIWMVRKYGFAEAQWKWLVSMNGRYSANVVMSANSILYDSVISFKVWPILIIIAWISSIYALICYLFGSAIARWKRLAAALFIVAVYYINLPGIHDGVYWVSSIICYQIPLILFIALSTWMANRKQPPGVYSMAVLFVAILIISGFHEMIAFMAAAFGLFITVFNWIVNKNISKPWLMLFIGAGTSLIVRLVSILNRFNDSVSESVRWSLGRSIRMSLMQTGYHIVNRCMLSPSFWLGAIFVFYFTYRYNSKSEYKPEPVRKRVVWAGLVFLVFMILFPCFITVYVESQLAGMRVVNIAYFVFMAAVYTVVFLLSISFARRQHNYETINFTLRKCLFWISSIVILLTLFFPGNLKQVTINLYNGTASSYNRQVTDRFQRIKNCDLTSCRISCLSAQPYILCPVDVCQDPRLLEHLEKVYEKKFIVGK